MSSRSLAALLVAGCITAAAGGAYVAVRQNAASQPAVAAPVAAAPAPAASPQPVSETEALVGRTPASSGPADRGRRSRRPADPAPTVVPAPAAPIPPEAPLLERPDPVRSGSTARSEPVPEARTTTRRRPAAGGPGAEQARQSPPPAPANPVTPTAAPQGTETPGRHARG